MILGRVSCFIGGEYCSVIFLVALYLFGFEVSSFCG